MTSRRVLTHLGYWVDDVQEAAEAFGEALGLGPFLHLPDRTFTDLRAPGHESGVPLVFDHSSAFAASGQLLVELTQVLEIDPDLADALGADIGSVSHVSWAADDLAAEVSRLSGLGCAVICAGETELGSTIWLSGGIVFDHPIKLVESTSAIVGLWNQLRVPAL